MFQYTFIWEYNDTETLSTSIQKQYDLMQSVFGTHKSCVYTSLILDGRGAQDKAFEEMCQNIVDCQQGIYSVQWEYNDQNITLSITIDDQEKSIEGNLSFS